MGWPGRFGGRFHLLLMLVYGCCTTEEGLGWGERTKNWCAFPFVVDGLTLSELFALNHTSQRRRREKHACNQRLDLHRGRNE